MDLINQKKVLKKMVHRVVVNQEGQSTWSGEHPSAGWITPCWWLLSNEMFE